MDLVAALPTFTLAVVLISASPGPAMALIFRRAALRGFRPTVPTVLGLEAGLYFWALMAGAGLAAVVAASETAFLVLRVLGAGFLLLLGVRAWVGVLRSKRPDDHLAAEDGVEGNATRRGWTRSFTEGLIVQLANPKAAIFLFAFYPQFIPAGHPLLPTTAALALLQVMIESALYLGLAASIGRASTWFSRTKVRRRVEMVSGSVLIGLGVKVAATNR